MSPCDLPFCSRYPRIVEPIFVEMERASIDSFARSTGIVCMSAISHKVNSPNELVNGYLWGSGNSEPSQVHREAVTGETLKPYLNSARVGNRPRHYRIGY